MDTAFPEIEWQRADQLRLVVPQWLVHGVLPKQSTVCLYGKRGQGKTFLTLDFALSVATGRTWNGREVRRGAVAYLLADKPDGLRRRIDGWMFRNEITEGLGALATDRNWFFTAQARHPVNNPAGRAAIITALKKIERLELVVLDPLISFMSGNENDARDMQAVVDGLREISETLQCTVLVIHHEGKDNLFNSRGARGSSAFEAALDTVLYLQPRRCDIAYLKSTKQRDQVEQRPIRLRFTPVVDDEGRDLGYFPMVIAEEPGERTKNASALARDERVMDAVRAILNRDETADVKSILAEVNSGGFSRGYKASAIRGSLKELVAKGALICTSIGRKQVFDLPGKEAPNSGTELGNHPDPDRPFRDFSVDIASEVASMDDFNLPDDDHPPAKVNRARHQARERNLDRFRKKGATR